MCNFISINANVIYVLPDSQYIKRNLEVRKRVEILEKIGTG